MLKLGQYIISGIVSYFVALVLNFVIAKMSSVVSRPVNSVMQIDRPGFYWDIVLYSLVSCVVAVIIFRILLFYIPKYFIKKELGAASTYSIVIVISIAVTTGLFPISKDILTPKVSARQDVTGSLSIGREFGYLFVRPIDSDNCWLHEPIPLVSDQKGMWQASAYFGGRSGQKFELIAVASKIPLNPIPFSSPGPYDCTLIHDQTDRFVRLVQMK